MKIKHKINFTTQEITARSAKKKINKWILGAFLFIAIVALLMKIVDGILLDFGIGIDSELKDIYKFIHEPKNHEKFFANQKTWTTELDNWYKRGDFHLFHFSFWSNQIISGFADDPNIYSNHKPLKEFSAIMAMFRHHPNSLWFLTQFTWITTIIIILYLLFRFFKFDETLPNWMSWITSQKTLSTVTIYDSVVGIVFWAAMFKDFDTAFNPTTRIMEMTFTILVHAVVPIMFMLYSSIYVLFDKKASIIKERYVFKSMIYPLSYTIYYLLLSAIWADPYSFTSLHESLITTTVGETLTGHLWAGELWKMVIVIVVLWILIGFMILVHNLILLKFNKKYDIKTDHEARLFKERKIEHIKHRVIRKYARKSNVEELIKKEVNRRTGFKKKK